MLNYITSASETGYGTASYLRLADISGSVHVVFVMGKARVAPLKVMTIPRLSSRCKSQQNVEGRIGACSG